jgi:hypothetical protein
MPNFNRRSNPSLDDLDIATRVMETVQKQIASYRDALLTVREMRQRLSEYKGGDSPGGRVINSAKLLATLFEEEGIPQQLSRAMAAEEFQDASFLRAQEAFWTWDCCCTDCCLTAPPDCTLTFVYPQ